MTSGQVDSVSVGIVFEFKDWSPENYVLVPAAVYDGNRFDIKKIGYPPYWYDPNEWRIDMPTTMTQNPTLGRGPGGGLIHLNTGDASMPLLAYQSQSRELFPICASWTVSYDFHFPPNSAMGLVDARSCGGVWANVLNKHGAPAICTWSGDCLLKYYRATGDKNALELLTHIAHGGTQYISRSDRNIGKMKPGEICERVNLSDWEGTLKVGGNIFGSCSWVETAALLTITQLPGVYVQPDGGLAVAFDNVRIENLNHSGNTIKFRLVNPTKFAADVSVLVESSQAARQTVSSFVLKPLPVVHLEPGASKVLEYTVPDSTKN